MLPPAPDDYAYVAAAVFVLAPDASGVPRYQSFNRFAEQHSGKSAADVVGRCALEIYGNRYGQFAFDRHMHVLRTKKPLTYDLELPLVRKPTWVRTTLVPELDATGAVIRMIGTSFDISGEYKARNENTALETNNREYEQFVSLAAHDLRAPLRNISSLTELLLEEFEDLGDGKIDMIHMLQEVAQHAGKLIADVLDHSHTANLAHSHSEFDFNELCDALHTVLDPAGAHRFRWSSQILRADKTAIQIVLRNLLDNAIKHGGRDSLSLEITVSQRDAGFIAIQVSYDGKGFENPGRAFLETGAFRTDSGYGLLAIRRLVQARGGTIEANNAQDGTGGIVSFTVPGSMLPDDLSIASHAVERAV